MAYEPRDVPFRTEDINTFLSEEFSSVAEGIRELQLFERNEEPDKPFTGQLVLADGTNWNPGSGRGFYGYDGSIWRFLG